MLSLSLRQHYFDAIKSGLKTVEGRINSSRFENCKPGDTVSFTCVSTNETIICTVTAVTVYTNFYDMLQAQGVENMLPGVTTLQDGVAMYEAFPGYEEQVKISGAIAINIKVM